MKKKDLIKLIETREGKKKAIKIINKEIKVFIKMSKTISKAMQSTDEFNKACRVSREEELVRKHFSTDAEAEWLSATECLHLLSKVVNVKAISVNMVGKALSQLDYPNKNPGGNKKYLVSFKLKEA